MRHAAEMRCDCEDQRPGLKDLKGGGFKCAYCGALFDETGERTDQPKPLGKDATVDDINDHFHCPTCQAFNLLITKLEQTEHFAHIKCHPCSQQAKADRTFVVYEHRQLVSDGGSPPEQVDQCTIYRQAAPHRGSQFFTEQGHKLGVVSALIAPIIVGEWWDYEPTYKVLVALKQSQVITPFITLRQKNIKATHSDSHFRVWVAYDLRGLNMIPVTLSTGERL